MKLLLAIFITLSIALDSKGQDCKTLDSLNSFHELKFGSTIPVSLSKICRYYHNGSGCVLLLDSLKGDNWKQFSNLFSFTYERFSTLVIGISDDKEIYVIALWSALNFIDSTVIANNKYPYKFNTLHDKLVSLFGKASRSEENNPNEPTLVSVLGRTFKYIWDCKNIRLELFLEYGSNNKDINSMGIRITQKNIEKKEAIKEIKN